MAARETRSTRSKTRATSRKSKPRVPSRDRSARQPGGRPRIDFDYTKLDRLLKIGATLEECAAVLAVSGDTIERRVQEKHQKGFAEYSREKRKTLKASLRRRFWQRVLSKDAEPALLIFAAKNRLGMADRKEVTGKGGKPLVPEQKQTIVFAGQEIVF